MQPLMENPALAKRGVPETDLAGALINPEYATPQHRLQVSDLSGSMPSMLRLPRQSLPSFSWRRCDETASH